MQCSENFSGNFQNNVIGGLQFFCNTSDTCGLKIRFKNFDFLFALVLHFCTGITLFALVLPFNCTILRQSESSNLFMYSYVIRQ